MRREAGSDGVSLREFAQTHARQALIVLVVAALAGGSAFLVAGLQTKMYEATARLVFGSLVDSAAPEVQPVYASAYVNAELESVPPVLEQQHYEDLTAETVAAKVPGHAPYTLAAAAVIRPSTVTSWAEVTARSSDPKVAEVAANAAVSSFFAYRHTMELQQVENDLKANQARLRAFVGAAAKQTNAYGDLLQAVQALTARRDFIRGGGSSFRVVTPATTPKEPYAPKPLQTAFLAFVTALVVGVGVVLLLDNRDSRVRDAAAVRTVLGLPLLGEVQLAFAETDGLAGMTEATDRESFRALRANMEFQLADRQVRSLGVGGCEHTSGRSLLACGLAVAKALSGKRVALIDGDLRRGLLCQHLGLRGDLGLTNVVAGGVELAEAIQAVGLQGPDEGADASIAVLCSGPEVADPELVIESHRFASLIAQLGQEFDLAIVITPAFADGNESAAVAAVDGLVCVVDATASRRHALEAFRNRVNDLECEVLGAVILSEAADAKGSKSRAAEANIVKLDSDSPVPTR